MKRKQDQSFTDFAKQLIDEFHKAVSLHTLKRLQDNDHLNELSRVELKECQDYSDSKKASNPIVISMLANFGLRRLYIQSLLEKDIKLLSMVIESHEQLKRCYSESYTKNLEVYKDSERIGHFVLGLKLAGSSINQAKKSVSKWIRKSETFVEEIYTNIPDKENEIELGQISWAAYFYLKEIQMASMFLDFDNDHFPKTKVRNSVGKTYNAFLTLRDAFKQHLQENPFTFQNMDILTLDHEGNEYLKTREKFLAQF